MDKYTNFMQKNVDILFGPWPPPYPAGGALQTSKNSKKMKVSESCELCAEETIWRIDFILYTALCGYEFWT